MRLPALLNFPDHGTLRMISPASNNVPGASNINLGYDATRGAENFIRVSFPRHPTAVRMLNIDWR